MRSGLIESSMLMTSGPMEILPESGFLVVLGPIIWLKPALAAITVMGELALVRMIIGLLGAASIRLMTIFVPRPRFWLSGSTPTSERYHKPPCGMTPLISIYNSAFWLMLADGHLSRTSSGI